MELTDLQGAPHLNGKQGKVVEARAEGGRVGVLLADKRAPISLKPSNLKLFVTALDSNAMKDFVLDFGPFLFRQTEDTLLVEALREWCEGTKRKVAGEAEAQMRIADQKKQMARTSQSMSKHHSMRWLAVVEAQSMVDMTMRFLELDASLRTWETLMRGVLHKCVDSTTVKAAAQVAYDDTLHGLMASKEKSVDSQASSALCRVLCDDLS